MGNRVEIKVQKLWFLAGHYLGDIGMYFGPKEVVFHGCKDNVVNSITELGFDDKFAKGGKAFGPGLYFSTQSCKAFSYAENHLLLCEVALGKEDDRLTALTSDNSLSYRK